MSESSAVSALVYVGIPKPPETSPSWMPPTSLYWIQKSASSISSAAGKRSRAASPGFNVPGLKADVRWLSNKPPPNVPAPMANDLPKKERRLMELFEDFVLPSELFFAVNLLRVFMRRNQIETHRPSVQLLKSYTVVTYDAEL